MKKCKICGKASPTAYCSKRCYAESQRIRYRKMHPAYENFYVFYDRNDFVKFFGTCEQLLEDGTFPTRNAFHSAVSKIKKGLYGNTKVYVLKCKKEWE